MSTEQFATETVSTKGNVSVTKTIQEEAGKEKKAYSAQEALHGDEKINFDTAQTKEPAEAPKQNIIIKAIQSIPIDLLQSKEWHPRENPEKDIAGLQASIEKDGVLEPPVVKESGDGAGIKFIVSGARRIAAARKAGIRHIDCLVMPSGEDADAAHRAFMSNENRKSWSEIEEAKHLLRMTSSFGFTLEDLEVMGYGSTASICQKTKLLESTQSVQDMVSDKKITAAHARKLLKLETAGEQDRMANITTRKGYSVKQLEAKITRYNRRKKKQAENPEARPDIGETDIPNVYLKSSEQMPELADESVQLIMTSPPYGLGKEFEKSYTPETIFEEVKPVLDECSRVMTPGGIMVVNIADIQNFSRGGKKNKHNEWHFSGVKYQQYLRQLGFHLRDVVQWWKNNFNWADCSHMFPVKNTPHTRYRFVNHTEHILIFEKEGERALPPEDVQIDSHLTDEQFKEYGKNVWKVNIVPNHGHPCVYPEELCERVIRMFSFEGDTVLDPFLGSGTTVKVARNLGRIGIGYERDLKYKPVIIEKLGIKPAEVPVAEASNKMMEYTEIHMKDTYAVASPDIDSTPSASVPAEFSGMVELSEELSKTSNIPLLTQYPTEVDASTSA